MNELQRAGQTRFRLAARLAAAALALLLALAVAIAIIPRTPQFHRWLEGRVTASLQAMSGGRVEISRLEWSLWHLGLELDGVTVHGTEPAGEPPYLHVDRVVLEGKILSLPGRRIGLRSAVVDHPVIHFNVDRQGQTNQPQPRGVSQNQRNPVQSIFDLDIDHAQVNEGELFVNNRRVPIEIDAQRLRAQLAYERNRRLYQGRLETGSVLARYRDYRPLASSLALEFELAPNQAVLKSFRLTSGHSQLQGDGSITNFQDPRITLAYQGSLQLPELAALARVPEIRRGVVQLAGSADYGAGGFSAAGKAQLKDGEWYDPSLRLPDLNGGAQFVLRNGDLLLPQIFGVAYGGTATGSAEIRNWANVPPPVQSGIASGWEQRGTLHLRVQNMALPSLITAISSQMRPLGELNLVGTASGTVETRWTGSPARAVSELQLNLAAPSRIATSAPAPGRKTRPALALSGPIHLTHYAATRKVELSQVDLRSDSLGLKLGGSFDQTRSDLHLSLTAGNIQEMTSLLGMFVPAGSLPAGVAGQVAFRGTVSGNFASPVVAGRLEARDVSIPLPLPGVRIHGTSPALHGSAHLDRFAADLRYTADMVTLSNGSLRSGSQSAVFQFSSGLLDGKIADASPLALSTNVEGGLLEHMQVLAGYDNPIAGTVNATLRLGGTWENPSGTASVHLANATLYGESFNSADADLNLARQRVEADKLALARGGARITGTAGLDTRAGSFHFDLRGSNFELAQLPQVQTARTSVGGRLNFTARGSGTAAHPAIEADLSFQDLILTGEPLGDLRVQAATSGDTLRLSGRSRFPTSELTVDGNIRLAGDLPGTVELHFTRLDIDSLLHQFLRGRITGHSSLTGVATARGPFRHPGLLNLELSAEHLSADMEQLHLENQGPVRASLSAGTLQLQQLRLRAPETEFTATGSVHLAGAEELDLNADGRANLALLRTYNPDLRSSGEATFTFRVGGTVSRPDIRGQLQVQNGGISFVNLPNALNEINGTVVFNQNRMQVQTLTAQTGGGAVAIGGFVDYAGGLQAALFNVTAQGKDMRLRYPQGVSSAVTADLHLTGSVGGALLSGNVTIQKVNMNPQFDFAVYLAQARRLQAPPNPNSLLSKVRLDVRVVSTPGLNVQTSLAKLSGDIDLRVRGTVDHPVLLGRINITEGRVAFNGTTYEVERGDISFSNPVQIEPVFDVELGTRVRDYDIGLGFHGPLERLSTTYRSEPPLPTTDIINLLAFGRTPEEAATVIQPTPSFNESASNAILSQALNATSSDRVQKLFGVSHFKISPNLGGPEINTNAQVSIEQQVSRNITLTYVTNLSQSQQQIIQMEYNINRDLSIVALRDQNGVVSFVVRLRRRRR